MSVADGHAAIRHLSNRCGFSARARVGPLRATMVRVAGCVPRDGALLLAGVARAVVAVLQAAAGAIRLPAEKHAAATRLAAADCFAPAVNGAHVELHGHCGQAAVTAIRGGRVRARDVARALPWAAVVRRRAGRALGAPAVPPIEPPAGTGWAQTLRAGSSGQDHFVAGPHATVQAPAVHSGAHRSAVGAALPARTAARVRRLAASEVRSWAAASCQPAALASSPAPSPLAWIHAAYLQPSVELTRRHQHAGARLSAPAALRDARQHRFPEKLWSGSEPPAALVECASRILRAGLQSPAVVISSVAL